MAKLQLARAESVGVVPVDMPADADIIVDALFGAGLSRPLSEEMINAVDTLNSMSGFKIACDIPTGLDDGGKVQSTALKSDKTVTMGALKESLYSDEAKNYAGDIVCVDLGIKRILYEDDSKVFLLEESDFVPPTRKKLDSHKGTYGHVAVFCGEKEGAGIIAASAAARFGAGLSTLVVHEKIVPPSFLMHANMLPSSATAIAVGMGLGNHFESETLHKDIVENDLPIVLDADSFYREDMLTILNQKDRTVVLTPHPREFSAMWRILRDEVLTVEQIQKNRFSVVRNYQETFPNTVLILKGANMIIAGKGKIFVNPIGTPALAKGGSGDVLSGLIVALLAQGYSALDAAINGSLALTMAPKNYPGNNYSLIPLDLIEMLPEIISK